VHESIASELRIEPVRDGVFQARLGGWEGRSFGGATLGCATVAASQGCEGRALHSLHAYFLRPVPPEVAIEFHVEKLSEGRRLAHRRVQVRFEGRLLCEMTASFATAQEGPAYQDALMDRDVPAPETLMPDVELAKIAGWEGDPPPVEWRWIEYPELPLRAGEAPVCRGWARPRAPLPDDPGLHAAALVYLSDWASQGAVQRRYPDRFAPERFVSLDHAVRLHRPARWDRWLLITARSDVAASGRAFTRREVYDPSGALVASIDQEGLIGLAGAP
jgi:acyl-CoA thioesterase-2